MPTLALETFRPSQQDSSSLRTAISQTFPWAGEEAEAIPPGLRQQPHQNRAPEEPEDSQPTPTSPGLAASAPGARPEPPFQEIRVSSGASLHPTPFQAETRRKALSGFAGD